MLPAITKRRMEFSSPTSALSHLSDICLKRQVLSISNLTINENGLMNYGGTMPIDGFKDLPLSDFALSQINDLAKVNSSWANNTTQELHSHSINEQLKRQEFGVTVVVEAKKSDPSQKHVAAILVGERTGISNLSILQYLAMREIDANILLDNGFLNVHFGNPLTIEALPEDNIRVVGYINNEQWGAKSRNQPSLETGLYTLRLVCTNGAYSRRNITKGSSMAWASAPQVEKLLESHVNRVQKFQEGSLKNAAIAMSNAIPEDNERKQIIRLIQKSVTEVQSAQLLDSANTSYDFWNAITHISK